MKKFILMMFLITVQAYFLPAYAENGYVLSASGELEKLKQERQAIESNSKKEEATCYKKFAVNNCLQDVKATTQKSLNVIKRHELEIKDSQRNAKIESTDKKQTDNKKDVTPPYVGDIPNVKSNSEKTREIKSSKTDEEILVDKTASDRLRLEQAKIRLDDSNRKLAASQRKTQIRESKNNQSVANVAKYNQKIALSAAKKAALEKENSERKKPRSPSLPIPNIVSAPTLPSKAQ